MIHSLTLRLSSRGLARAGAQCLLTYLLGVETIDPGTGLLAAALVAVNPATMPDTVVGAFGNDALAVPLTLAILLCYLRAVRAHSTSFTWLFASQRWRHSSAGPMRVSSATNCTMLASRGHIRGLA
jgi:hypothetical protein